MAGSRSSPANTSTGSTGDRRASAKTPMVTSSATGTMSTRRRRMYLITPSPPLSTASRSLAQLRGVEARDAVRVNLHAGHLLGRHQGRDAELEPDPCRVVDYEDLLRLLQQCLPLGRVRLGAPLIHEVIDLRVRVRRVVVRLARHDEVVAV